MTSKCVIQMVYPLLATMLTEAALAGGAIVPVSQDRSAYGWISGYTPMTVTAPSFAPFNASAGYTIGQPYFVTGSARQDSAIDNGVSMTAWGMASGSVHRGNFQTAGATDFSFTFDLTVAGTYTLSGYTTFNDTYGDPDSINNPPTVTLSGPGGLVFAAPAAPADGTPADFGAPGATFTLPAGRYTLEAHCAAASALSGAGTTSDFSLLFERACVPCDADCNGTVNPFDIQPLLGLLSGEMPCSPCAGDANGDGTVSPFDIQAFLTCLGA